MYADTASNTAAFHEGWEIAGHLGEHCQSQVYEKIKISLWLLDLRKTATNTKQDSSENALPKG